MGPSIITLYGSDMEKALAEGGVGAIELTALGLSERQRRAVEYMLEHGRITNREYRELWGVRW